MLVTAQATKSALPESTADARCVAESDTATLLRTAAVVRNRRHVRNRVDADAQRGERANRRFATRARALDLHVQVLDALVLSGTAGHFGGHLRRERRALARTLEALAAARCPGQRAALTIGDRDDRVVERRVHVRDAVRNVLADLLAY